MLRRRSVPLLVLASTLLALGLGSITGCGGSGEAKSPSGEKAEVSSLEELQAMPKEINAELSALTKPIDDVGAVIEQLTSIPKRHGINAGELASLAKATFDNGTVKVELKGDVSAEAKAEVEAALNKLKDVVAQLKAVPEKAAAMTPKLAAATAKIPVLATKVSTGATLAISSPFANGETKAKANGDLAAVKTAQAEASKAVSDAQAKITGIPAMATGALGKLGASFASMS